MISINPQELHKVENTDIIAYMVKTSHNNFILLEFTTPLDKKVSWFLNLCANNEISSFYEVQIVILHI